MNSDRGLTGERQLTGEIHARKKGGTVWADDPILQLW
jgi:hypothetical protein